MKKKMKKLGKIEFNRREFNVRKIKLNISDIPVNIKNSDSITIKKNTANKLQNSRINISRVYVPTIFISQFHTFPTILTVSRGKSLKVTGRQTL